MSAAPEAAAALGPLESYARLATRLATEGITDPWLAGNPRFSAAPVVVSRRQATELACAAESVAAVLDEMCGIVARAPDLLGTFFRLTPVQQLLFRASYPFWHVHARADVFLRAEQPPVVCELNCDTPSGYPEAVGLNRIALDAAAPELGDPCAELVRAFVASALRFARGKAPLATASAVGIVYPTELSEDLALVALLERAFRAAGHEVVLGSPYNLHVVREGGVGLFGRELGLVVRHYKTDWWGERLPLWRDEAPFLDPEPLERPLRLLLEAELAGRVSVVNPFGSVLPQNKRAYAFLWERRAEFSAGARAAIDAHVPFSVRLEVADRAELERARADWVLKSDYGCEGEEVLLGALLTQAQWREALALAVPERWIAQRRFDARRDAAGRFANHGVFLTAGRATGLYTRLSAGPTDARALSVPTLVES